VHIDPNTLSPGAKLRNDFEWLNIYDPVDVIASKIKSFGIPKDGEAES